MIDKLHKRSPFVVLSLMIYTMRNTGFDTTLTCVFRYPVILSRVFAAFNVDFTGKRVATTG